MYIYTKRKKNEKEKKKKDFKKIQNKNNYTLYKTPTQKNTNT